MITLQDEKTEIKIGEGVLGELSPFASLYQKGQALCFCSNSEVWQEIKDFVKGEIPWLEKPEILFRPGESNKQIEEVKRAWEILLKNGVDRHAYVINIGGGVVCDMGGFMSSTYKRGIPFINVPTSLLAMADASVGGKTAINIGEEKNMVGVFSRPEKVLIDPRFLATLSKREFLSGVSEIFKMQLLSESAFSIENADSLFEQQSFKVSSLINAIEAKIDVVKQDFKEEGRRKILNLGHTYGHAFEALYISENKEITHGQAVAWGIVFELYISLEERHFPAELFRKIRNILLRNYGKPCYSEKECESLLAYMLHDKKNTKDKIAPVLMCEPGKSDYRFEMSSQKALYFLKNGESIFTF